LNPWYLAIDVGDEELAAMSLLFGGRPLLPLSGFGFAIAAHEVIATKSKNYSN
jgi:hypothetical protein